jgi:hypothetical protein
MNVNPYELPCEIHYAGGVVIGNVTSALAFVRARGCYFLVTRDMGCGHLLATFDVAPTPDPLSPEAEARIDAIDEAAASGASIYLAQDEKDLIASGTWWDVASLAMTQLHAGVDSLTSVYRFVADLVAHAGYDPATDPLVECWLYDVLGQMILDYEGSDRATSDVARAIASVA